MTSKVTSETRHAGLGSRLQDTSLTAKELERKILRDIILCVLATTVFAAATSLLSLQTALADWMGMPEFKEMDVAVLITIYAVWMIGIFTLRRLYDLRSVMGEREAIERELGTTRTAGAVGRMASGVAHDFNNLLMIIKGSLDIFMGDADADDSKYADLQPALDAIDGAARLSGQLMELGRQKGGQLINIDLNEVISDMMKLLKHISDKGGIVFQTSLEPGRCLITANKGQIEQVILNLVTNACDSMDIGGTLKIETKVARMCRVTEHGGLKIPVGEYALMKVIDTGEGMTPEVMAHMYEPYFTTKKTGTGLGLATLYAITEQNGGVVDIGSQPGEGTSINIYWPAARMNQLDGISGAL